MTGRGAGTARIAGRDRLSDIEQLGRATSVAPVAGDQTLDFTGVARTALNWRMGATLLVDLRRHGLEGRLPDDIREALTGAYTATVMRNRVLRRHVVEVLRVLAAVGIRPIVLKGGVRLLSMPEGAPCPRFMEDLDLLVAPDAYREAGAVVERLGFVAATEHEAYHHHGPKLRHPDTGTVIELHHRPLYRDRPAFTAGLVAEAVSLPVTDGLSVRVPSARYRILHNMIHSQDSDSDFVNGVVDPRRLHEFAELCADLGDRIDWPWLIGTAEGFGLRTHMMAWIYAAHRIFGLPPPPDARFHWIERRQFARVRNGGNRGSAATRANQVVMFHLFAWMGLLQPGLGTRYRRWTRRALGMGPSRSDG